MIGFTYDGIHSSTYGISAKTVTRPLLPTLTARKLTIPGRSGSYDFGDNVFEDRIIEVELRYIGTSFNELRSRARTISAWLSGYSGKKNLIFDDEAAKYYVAKIYSSIGLSNLFTIGECKVQFECEPFAYSITLRGVTATVTASGEVLTISSSGTVETPPIVALYNDGTSAISTFTLTRETLI
jgi:predicted phage tail component-like protein